MSIDSSQPVAKAEFAGFMAGFAPFEPSPHIGMAISGGADSMALALLVNDWAQSCGGTVTAFHIDHGLRRSSAREALQIQDWLLHAGIECAILPWTGSKPSTGLQDAARLARYALLEAACAERRILHLALGHQRDDQVETIAMRTARGSGPVGRAGMASVRELSDVRVLRPLLGVCHSRLVATCLGFGQDWIEDPSNADHRFERVRWRAASLPEPDRSVGSKRAALERAGDVLLVHAATIYPEGWAAFDPTPFLIAEPSVRLHASSRLLTTIGGRIYPSRGARLARLMDTLARDGAKTRATLGGCLIAPMQFGRLVIAREPLKDRRLSVLDRPVLWDGRFLASTTSSQILHIGALLQGDMAQVKECSDPVLWSLLPHAARLACPGIFEGDTLVAVPHLGWSVPEVAVDFAPAVPLSTANFI